MNQLDTIVINCKCGKKYEAPFDTKLFLESSIYKQIQYECSKCKERIVITKKDVNKYLKK
jgi:predicted SprT family Zn-dependent metalloprotease